MSEYFAFSPQVNGAFFTASLVTQGVVAKSGANLLYPAIAVNAQQRGELSSPLLDRMITRAPLLSRSITRVLALFRSPVPETSRKMVSAGILNSARQALA